MDEVLFCMIHEFSRGKSNTVVDFTQKYSAHHTLIFADVVHSHPMQQATCHHLTNALR